MKKSLLSCLFAVLAIGAMITSCSDDKEDALQSAVYEDNLTLMYSGQPMLGKRVSFNLDADDASKATLTLSGADFKLKLGTRDNMEQPTTAGVIPGEITTMLQVDLKLNEDGATFAGRDEKNGRIIEYSGKVSSRSMQLSLKVVMPQNELTGKAFVPDQQNPLLVNWQADPFEMNGKQVTVNDLLRMAAGIPVVNNMTLPQLVCYSLGELRFLPDGNIQALIRTEKTGGQLIETPLNILSYAVKGNKVLLYVNAIQIAEMKKTRSEDLMGDVAAIIGAVNRLLVEGIPVTFATVDGHTLFYLDQDLLKPVLLLIKPLLGNQALMNLLLNLLTEKVGPEMAPMIIDGIVKPLLAALPGIIDSTTVMQFGLNMTPAPAVP